METKSRYEVIAELEDTKRALIRDMADIADTLYKKENNLKVAERNREDNIRLLDRQIDDMKSDIANFKDNMSFKKTTLEEQIKSIDEGLMRFDSQKK